MQSTCPVARAARPQRGSGRDTMPYAGASLWMAACEQGVHPFATCQHACVMPTGRFCHRPGPLTIRADLTHLATQTWPNSRGSVTFCSGPAALRRKPGDGLCANKRMEPPTCFSSGPRREDRPGASTRPC
jgi:hypothetical protein